MYCRPFIWGFYTRYAMQRYTFINYLPPPLLIIINNCNTSLISKFFNIFSPKRKMKKRQCHRVAVRELSPGVRAPKAVRNPAVHPRGLRQEADFE